jgi:hypothetical protein
MSFSFCPQGRLIEQSPRKFLKWVFFEAGGEPKSSASPKAGASRESPA